MFRLFGQRARWLSTRTRPANGRVHLGFENLERREMLSGTPPTVTDVSVSSTAWSTEFLDYLETNSLGNAGYSIPSGSTAQSDSLPWENIDQIKITFSKDVYIDAADFSLSGVNTVNYQVDDFFYDAYNYVATWTLDNVITLDRLMVDLDADGLDPITDLAGNVLDGEWVNNVSSGPSGDGTAGGDFEFEFTVLPGDVNQDDQVDVIDLGEVYQLEDETTSEAAYSAFDDIDGSGVIDNTDIVDVISHLWTLPPSGQPVGATDDAPTTSGFASMDLDDPALDIAISLFAAFDDAEDNDNQLNYQIVGNTDPSLLDNTSINPTTGELILSAAFGASGRTTITVMATDSQGLSTQSTIPVDVDYENQPPVIYNYIASAYPGNTWLFTGYVADSDDDIDGFVVEFGGVFSKRYTVNETGYFEFAVILDEDEWGYEWALTHDPNGAISNVPQRLIGLT